MQLFDPMRLLGLQPKYHLQCRDCPCGKCGMPQGGLAALEELLLWGLQPNFITFMAEVTAGGSDLVALR